MTVSMARKDDDRLLSLAIGGLIALAAAMGVGRFVYTPILPAMAEDLGLSKSAAGLIASANYAGYLAGALLAATPWIRGSRRRWMLCSLAASALTGAMMALTTSVVLMMAIRFISGVASAFVLIFASSLVLDRLRAHGRSGLAPLFFAGVGSGIALSAVLVSGMAAAGIGWRGQWLGTGAVSGLALLAVMALVPDQAEPPPPPARSAGGRGYGRVLAAYGLFGFGYVITATFIVLLTRGSPAIRPLEPVIWLILGTAAIPSVAIWTLIGRRLGVTSALALACLVEAVGVVSSVLWVSEAGIVLAAVTLGGTIMGITALGIAAARQLAPGDASRAIAAMTAAFGLGQIVGPLFAGYVVDHTGNFIAASLTAAATLVLAAILSWSVPRSA